MIRTLLTMILCWAASASAADEPVPTGRLPRDVIPLRYALELDIDPQQPRFAGKVAIDVRIARPTRVVWLHGRDLAIVSAVLRTRDGAEIALAHAQVDPSGVLKLTAKEPLPAGEATLALAWGAAFNERLESTYKVTHAGAAYVMTQMEATSARLSLPSFDEPAFKTPWDVAIVAPAADTVVANAPELARESLAAGRVRHRFATTQPLPTYLLAWAIGPWDLVEAKPVPASALRKQPVPLRGVTVKGRGEQMRYALERTAPLVLALEEYFAIAYPFAKLDLLAAPDYAFGAMENAGLIVYRDELMLLDAKSPTLIRRGFLGVHAHELAHQWFGNLVTMPWWNDIWLNEAFATWIGTRIAHQVDPSFHLDRNLLQSALDAMNGDALASTRRIAEPVEKHTDILAAFDSITYSKGGAVLSMFESFLGAERFRDAVRAHMRKFAFGSATSLDLMASLGAASGDPPAIRAAFASFTEQAGTPFLAIQAQCDDARMRLHVVQSRYRPLGATTRGEQTWQVPFCARYEIGGKPFRHCEMLTQAEQDVTLPGPGCPTFVMPNAGGAGYYRYALDAGAQRALDAAFERLDQREQRIYADSVLAAYKNGTLGTRGFLDALPRLASAASSEVASATLDNLNWIDDHLVADAAQRAALAGRVRANYARRLDGIGLAPRSGEDEDAKLLRRRLTRALADLGDDRELQQQLAARGRRLVGVDSGKLDLDAVDADQRDAALWALAQAGGEPAFAAIERSLRATEDSDLRESLLTGLGQFREPALAARARELTFDENAVRTSEVPTIVGTQLADRETHADAQAWTDANLEKVLARLPPVYHAFAPYLLSARACSDERADWLEQRLRQRMANVEGGPRRLDQAVETVRLCAARRSFHAREDLSSVLAPAAAGGG